MYVVECADKSLYCGITTCVSRRLHEHNFTKKAAKYTRSRRPVRLVFQSDYLTRSFAASVEAKFKRLPAKQKRKLIENDELFRAHFYVNDPYDGSSHRSNS